MDEEYRKENIISSAMVINILGILLTLISIPLQFLVFHSWTISIYTAILTIVELFQVSIKEYIRGIGNTTLYMIGGFINAAVQVILSFFFIFILEWGLVGYIAAIGVAYILEIIFYLNRTKVIISKKYFDKNITISLLKYSLPLAPNKIMWWIISASDRYYVLWMIGASATGLYAVAAKIPAIITIMTNIFFQAWQMSAITESNSNDKAVFYNKIFDLIWSSIGVLTAVLLLLIKYIVGILVSDTYFSAWTYAPFLLVAAYFGAIQSFLGVNYTIVKNSIGTLVSTTSGAVTNLILNYFLIKHMGIQGATIATLISYIVVCLYRYFDTRNIVSVNSKTPIKMILTSISLIVDATLLAIFPQYYILISTTALLLILALTKQHFYAIFRFFCEKNQTLNSMNWRH